MITSKRVFLSERLAKVHPQDGNVNITINAAMKKKKKLDVFMCLSTSHIS